MWSFFFNYLLKVMGQRGKVPSKKHQQKSKRLCDCENMKSWGSDKHVIKHFKPIFQSANPIATEFLMA